MDWLDHSVVLQLLSSGRYELKASNLCQRGAYMHGVVWLVSGQELTARPSPVAFTAELKETLVCGQPDVR